MDELQTYQAQLPDTLEDLSRFVLVNEERVQALRAEIRAIKKVSLAKEVYEQKLAEAQEIGKVTVEAAQKMGELLSQIDKASGGVNQYNKEENLTDVRKSKMQTVADIGITQRQSEQYQQMADNPKAVQAAINKAIERGDVVSRSQVMREIRSLKEQLTNKDRKIEELESRKPKIIEKEVLPDDYQSTKQAFQKLRRDYADLNEKLQTSEREKERMKREWESEKSDPQKQITESALKFCAGIRAFIKEYGGYIWLSESINEMPQIEKDGFISGINALDAWVQKMKENMEENNG